MPIKAVADKSQVAHWLNTSYSHIRAFEKQLTDDGYVLLKFFVHVSKKQQKENMEKLNKIYGKNWKKLDVEEHDENDYDKFINAYEEMFAETAMPMRKCLPKRIPKTRRGI